MSYFAHAEELVGELRAALELFLSTPEGKEAAKTAASGFDKGEGLPDEPSVVLVTSAPETATTLVLGDRPRVEDGGTELAAQVQFQADGNALHNLLLEKFDAGQIARAIEEKRLSVSGPPWALDALIVLAGALTGAYRASLEQRGRDDLLNTPAPPPAGVWEVPVPRPEDFMGAVVPARRQFTQTTSR
ncbi:hypothetical protein OHA44_37205 [Streptomyces sp. NBC_00144]|uniref:hypothetical protein n=1 Tax=Streptomyces sp. NBC_00144 TaxID=2975665 RepID=UPI00324E17B7